MLLDTSNFFSYPLNMIGYEDGNDAQFFYPSGCTLDGDKILVADRNNNCIRCLQPGNEVTTIAGTNEAGKQTHSGRVAVDCCHTA